MGLLLPSHKYRPCSQVLAHSATTYASLEHSCTRRYIDRLSRVHTVMSTSRLDTARRNLIGAFQSTKSTSPTVHSVTFQPFGHKDNDDRIAVERYLVLNKPWLFIVLCDGAPPFSYYQLVLYSLTPASRSRRSRDIRIYREISSPTSCRDGRAVDRKAFWWTLGPHQYPRGRACDNCHAPARDSQV